MTRQNPQESTAPTALGMLSLRLKFLSPSLSLSFSLSLPSSPHLLSLSLIIIVMKRILLRKPQSHLRIDICSVPLHIREGLILKALNPTPYGLLQIPETRNPKQRASTAGGTRGRQRPCPLRAQDTRKALRIAIRYTNRFLLHVPSQPRDPKPQTHNTSHQLFSLDPPHVCA